MEASTTRHNVVLGAYGLLSAASRVTWRYHIKSNQLMLVIQHHGRAANGGLGR
jgi:hypothetical protein